MVVPVSELSKRLVEAKGDRSIDDIARQAERDGHRLDRSAVARYLNGDHGPNPRPSTIEALAAGFGLDAREVRRLVGRPGGELGPWVPTPASASLTQRQRDALDQVIRVFTSKGGTSDDGKSDDQKRPPTGNVRPLSPKHQRMLEDAQEKDWAAYDGKDEGED